MKSILNITLLILFLTNNVIGQDSIDGIDKNLAFYEKSRKIESYIIDKDAIPVNSIINEIDDSCALFKRPHQDEIVALKKEYGEDDFYTIADDNIFYQYQAKQFLESEGIETADVYDSRYVKFVNKDGKAIYIDLRAKYSQPWNLLFFIPGKDIKVVDVTIIEDEYKSYFKEK
jgi:hypothetical protein